MTIVGTPPRARLRTTPRPLSSAPTTTAHGLSVMAIWSVRYSRRLAYFVCKHGHSDDAATTPSFRRISRNAPAGCSRPQRARGFFGSIVTPRRSAANAVLSSRRADVPSSKPEHDGFGVGQIAESRPVWPLEIFGRLVAEVFADQSPNWTVRIDDHQGSSARGQIAPDWPGKPDKILNIAAIDQLRAGHHAFRQAWQESERMGAGGCFAPQAQTAMRFVHREQVKLERIEGHVQSGIDAGYLDVGYLDVGYLGVAVGAGHV